MRYIYFSPHLDDAVLSAGGLIYDQARAGHAVEIWTFMSGFPDGTELTDFAKHLHELWGTTSAEETMRVRRAEDRRAAALIGAKAVHFDFLDCIYRRGRDGEFLYRDVFIRPSPAEADLPAQIAQTMIAWLRPDDLVVAQLAIGGHVDHLLVRRAVELLKKHSISWIADIPYLLNDPEDLAPKTAGMEDSAQPVSEAGLQAWQEAVEIYASQFSTLFDSPEIMRQKLHQYWSDQKGIRFWQSGQTN
ncbi:MAG TPA: PIG-L family deacetylase [Anaerolineales bacterium]|nr:PIG-L family deacetylase [Anaerolineales bacterium]